MAHDMVMMAVWTLPLVVMTLIGLDYSHRFVTG
jgi:hypothetical protein